VIGFALTVILAALALRVWRGHGTLRVDELRSARDLGDPFAAEENDGR
jgi:multisubunit Na+/H+ antiporter MnhC subunit